MASDGSITFSTTLDNKELDKAINQTVTKINNLKAKLEDQHAEKTFIEKQMDAANAAIDKTLMEMQPLAEKAADMYFQFMKNPDIAMDVDWQNEFLTASAQLEAMNSKYEEQQKELEGLESRHDKITEKIDLTTDSLERAKNKYAELRSEQEQLGNSSALERVKERFESIKSSLSGCSRGLESMTRKILGVAASVVGLAAIASHMRNFASSIWQAALANEHLQVTVNGVKAAYAGFATGIANAILPVLQGIVRVATSMLMTLARLIDTIFKTNLVGAIQSAAASYGAATSGAGKQAKATDKLAKSLKEANRQLMAFDELNVLNADQENDNADALDDVGGGGGGGGGIDNALIEGIDAGLAKIMLIAGAALIAIGLILAFTGHIAIGVALIALGALMMYTAYSEQWDKLPEEVQNQILGILQIIAGALIVIGVILLLFRQIPLGIGFIIAGATIFGITAVMSEGSIEGLVQAFHDNILGIIAGALIVIGIILCVTGVGLPVGIALIALGALAFVGQAVLNWNEMSDEMREFFSTAMRIIGGVLVVLGIMLCITGNIPLGIAAIIVGITVFVAQAALNEEDMPRKIEEFFANAIPILAGALVVIGIILCVTGVGLALGIAAIIAGIAILSVAEEKLNKELVPDEVENFLNGIIQMIKDHAEFLLVLGILLLFVPPMWPLAFGLIILGIVGLAMPEDYDFNAIKDKISEVWDSIVSWWHSNVEYIFTIGFWEGVFSSIADGLWNALSSAADAINGFFSDIAWGITDLAGSIGIGFSMGIPQVSLPFLASGAVIPPNRSFLAVLGDQTNGRNLEAPEGLIRQIVREESGAGSSNELLAAMYELIGVVQEGKTLYVDGQVLGRTARREIATMERMGGY